MQWEGSTVMAAHTLPHLEPCTTRDFLRHNYKNSCRSHWTGCGGVGAEHEGHTRGAWASTQVHQTAPPAGVYTIPSCFPLSIRRRALSSSVAGRAAMLKKHSLGIRNYPRREMPIHSRLGKHAGLSQKSSCYRQRSAHLRTAV